MYAFKIVPRGDTGLPPIRVYQRPSAVTRWLERHMHSDISVEIYRVGDDGQVIALEALRSAHKWLNDELDKRYAARMREASQTAYNLRQRNTVH